MLITIQKQTEVTVEIKTPVFLAGTTSHFKITESGDLIQVNGAMAFVSKSGELFHNSNIKEAISGTTVCTEEEFNRVYSETMANILAVNTSTETINL